MRNKHFILYCFCFKILIIFFTGCGSDFNFSRVIEENNLIITGTAEFNPDSLSASFALNDSIPYYSPRQSQRVVLDFANIEAYYNGVKFTTETDINGRFTLHLPLLVNQNVSIKIIALKPPYRLENEFSVFADTEGKHIVNINIDNASSFIANYKSILKEKYLLPENFSSGINDTAVKTSDLYKDLLSDTVNFVVNYDNNQISNQTAFTKIISAGSNNYVTWVSPAPGSKGVVNGVQPIITICFSNKMNKNIPWYEWLKFEPSDFIKNIPVFQWNYSGDKFVFILNKNDTLPVNTNITVTIDTNLLTEFNQTIEPFSWQFQSGNEIVFDANNYLYFFDNTKYVFYKPYLYFPFVQFSNIYKITNKTVDENGTAFLYYSDASNYLSFKLKKDGLYIDKIVDNGALLQFPTPVLVFPNQLEKNKEYYTYYNQHKYITKLKEYKNDYFNEFCRKVTVEITLPFEISNAVTNCQLTFVERGGLAGFSIMNSGNKSLRRVVKNPDVLFPANNGGINKNSANFIFNTSDYINLYRFQISADTYFTNLFFDTTTAKNNIFVDTNYFPNDYYYYRLAAINYEHTVDTTQNDWTQPIKFYVYSDTTKFVSSPPHTAFTNYIYRYSAAAASNPNDGKLMYSLISGPNNMRVNPHTGYLIWQSPASIISETYPVAIKAVNIKTGSFDVQSFVITLIDGKLIGKWKNMDYEFYFYSDYSMKIVSVADLTEKTGKFDVVDGNIIFYNLTEQTVETLENFNYISNQLTFIYNGNNLSLSRAGALQ